MNFEVVTSRSEYNRPESEKESEGIFGNFSCQQKVTGARSEVLKWYEEAMRDMLIKPTWIDSCLRRNDGFH